MTQHYTKHVLCHVVACVMFVHMTTHYTTHVCFVFVFDGAMLQSSHEPEQHHGFFMFCISRLSI